MNFSSAYKKEVHWISRALILYAAHARYSVLPKCYYLPGVKLVVKGARKDDANEVGCEKCRGDVPWGQTLRKSLRGATAFYALKYFSSVPAKSSWPFHSKEP